MIIDQLTNADRYFNFHPRVSRGIEFLRQANLTSLADGVHEIDEKRVFAIISHDEGRGKTNSLLEAHRNYFDIQYVIAGADCIGWLPTKMCERVSSEYNPDTDLIFYYDRPETWVHVPAGSFTILMPDDAHAPLATSGSIHKVVVKVQI
jgi:biofilm protein TabA